MPLICSAIVALVGRTCIKEMYFGPLFRPPPAERRPPSATLMH
jgi:hypothetical protein